MASRRLSHWGSINRDAAKQTPGFIRSNNYTISPYENPHADCRSSVIISEWNGEIDWDAWYTSKLRRDIVGEIAQDLIAEERHLVLSKNENQVFLL